VTRRLPRSPGTVVTVAGALGVAVAAFLPWGGSGDATRSSFELVQAAERLDLLRGGNRQFAAVLWYLLPALVALVWLAATFERPFATAALGAAVGVLAVGGALVVVASPLKVEPGVPIAVLAGGTAMGGAAFIALERRRP
jgi:hypothetical protein